MKKKLLTLSLIAVMSLSFTACDNGNDSTTSSTTEATTATQEIATEATTDEYSDIDYDDTDYNDVDYDTDYDDTDYDTSFSDFEPKGDSKALDFDITFCGDFRNDTTGRWRFSTYAESNEFQDYAMNYYEEYFKNDSEVHVVYNFTNKTVYCITNLGGMLSVNVTDYVKGEEHDASLACSGTHLATYMVYLDSGVVEQF